MKPKTVSGASSKNRDNFDCLEVKVITDNAIKHVGIQGIRITLGARNIGLLLNLKKDD